MARWRRTDTDYGDVTAGRWGLLLCRLGLHNDRGGLGLSWCSRCHKEKPPPLKRRIACEEAILAIDDGDMQRAEEIFEAVMGEKPVASKPR